MYLNTVNINVKVDIGHETMAPINITPMLFAFAFYIHFYIDAIIHISYTVKSE